MKSHLPSAVVCLFLVILCSGCGGGGGAGPDLEPPEIVSGPTVTGLAADEATISWTTDKACDSRVRYGQTTSYTDSVVSDAMVFSHSINLMGLHAQTLYHYVVSSEDQNGKTVTSGDKVLTTTSLVDDLLKEGWDLFEGGDFESTLDTFEEAYTHEPENVDVLEGLAWALLRLYGFDESLTYLDEALTIEPARLDCLVAAAFLYHSLGRCGDSLAKAHQVLALAGDTYTFAHDATITSSDIRYSIVLCLVATGSLTGALEQAKIIDTSISLDPDNASTWKGYPTFEEALLAVIEDLRLKV